MCKSVRELCRSDPFECALGVLCGKWKGMILFSLLGGAQRYGELRRVLLGISERTLAKQLCELCALGLVTREVDAACQLVVNYRLSAQGEALGPALRAMEAWGLQLLQQPARVRDRVSPQEAIVARRRTGRFPDASGGD